MKLRPEQYFPCFSPVEQGACVLAFNSVVPPYIFVIPCEPIDNYFASSPENFEGRQDLWVHMFGFYRMEIEILPGIMREVYADPNGFLLDWLTYPPIGFGEPIPRCRVNDYSLS